ncbi:MAG: hypothetical protein ACOVT5_03595 [Armatimonadaceae bacterium]
MKRTWLGLATALVASVALMGCQVGTVAGKVNLKGTGSVLDTANPQGTPQPSGANSVINVQTNIKITALAANPNNANATGTVIASDSISKVKLSGNALFGAIGDLSGARALATLDQGTPGIGSALQQIFGQDYLKGFQAYVVLGTVKACTAPKPSTLPTTMLPGTFINVLVDFPTIDLPTLLSDPSQPVLSEIMVFGAANDAYLNSDSTKPHAAYFLGGYGTKGGMKWNVQAPA